MSEQEQQQEAIASVEDLTGKPINYAEHHLADGPEVVVSFPKNDRVNHANSWKKRIRRRTRNTKKIPGLDGQSTTVKLSVARKAHLTDQLTEKLVGRGLDEGTAHAKALKLATRPKASRRGKDVSLDLG